MKKGEWIFRGMNEKEFKQIKSKGIPKKTLFTTDLFRVGKQGMRLIAVKYSKSGFIPIKKKHNFNERHFMNKIKRRNFIEVDFV